jgi:hypothetical protein
MPQAELRAASLRFDCNEIGDLMSEGWLLTGLQ